MRHPLHASLSTDFISSICGCMHSTLEKSDKAFHLNPRELATISHYLLSLAEIIMEDLIEIEAKTEHFLHHWNFKAKQEHGA